MFDLVIQMEERENLCNMFCSVKGSCQKMSKGGGWYANHPAFGRTIPLNQTPQISERFGTDPPQIQFLYCAPPKQGFF